MSLETLLEAAEFLEWSKTGKKASSRETRTSKRAEKFHPYVVTEKKKRAQKTAAASKTSQKKDEGEVHDTSDQLKSNHKSERDVEEAYKAEESALKDIKRCLGTRETHNKLEKNRRAHLKECFDQLRKELPGTEDRRTSNLATLRSALRYIDHLVNQQRDLENEKRRMQRSKNSRQAHINSLKKELKEKDVVYNIEDWIVKHDEITNSTSTASECGEVSESGHEANTDTSRTHSGMPANVATSTLVKPTDEIQLVIKAMPPSRIKPATNTVTEPKLLDKVTVEAPPQAIQMIQQAAIKASSHQRLHLQIAPANTIAIPAQQPQVVALSNLPTANTGTPQKIMLTPKPVGATLPMGQVLVSNPSFIVSQVQTIPVSTGPVAVNLQTGKVLAPRPTIVTAKQFDSTNLPISPKQLVLITADQQKLRATPIMNAPQSAGQVNNITYAQPRVADQAKTAMNTMIPITALNSLQAVKPTIITGMLPTTAADGSISYVPVTLTAKPFCNEGNVNTSFLHNGLTFVLPTSSSQSIQNVQVATVNPAGPQVTTTLPNQTSHLK